MDTKPREKNRTCGNVIILTAEEAEQAMRATLEDLGMTEEQLRGEAENGRFRSEKARIVWLALAGLGLVERNRSCAKIGGVLT